MAIDEKKLQKMANAVAALNPAEPCEPCEPICIDIPVVVVNHTSRPFKVDKKVNDQGEVVVTISEA